MKSRSECWLAMSLALLLLTIEGAASAARKPAWHGTIRVSGKRSEPELRRMAKITEATARKTALAAVRGKGKSAGEVELEVENGYLIYSADVHVKGKPDVEEILIDAGTGKVLAHEHESPAAEAKEKQGGG